MEKKMQQLILIVWFILSVNHSAFSQWNYERPVVTPLQGGSFIVGSTAEVVDDKWGTPYFSQITNSYRKKAVVSLHMKENDSIVLPQRVYAEVSVNIEWWDMQNNMHTENKVLSVSFNNDTLYNDTLISYYTFSDAHKVRVTIANIYTEGVSIPLPNIFVLKPELLFERDYDFVCTQHPMVGATPTTYLSNHDELLVKWFTLGILFDSLQNQINFVYEHMFDLEWTFYDDSSLVVKQFHNTGVSPYYSSLFKNNATRVTTTGNEYKLPMLYERGYLFFRIRSLKVLPNGQIISGKWTSDQFSGSNAFMYRVSGHEDKLNWQAATTFAEEGKRKSVVSYFDGSSKNRQTVTKINTDDIAVVAETIYDFEGRPVVSTLPSPTLDSIIKFHPKYNTNIAGNTYTWADIDSVGSECITGPRVMSNFSGSSKYYSYNNPLQATLPHSYIPEAFGFPFSQTNYTGDLTNRVRASAGPGKDHNFGATGNRYTKYLYGAPNQSDLTRMFGNEAGTVSHYFKNLVIDPNGQVSVTYQDMHGRTIATSLAGDTVTVDLKKLNEQASAVVLKDAIIDTNQSIEGLSIKATKKILVTNRGVHRFYYTLFPESYVITACDSQRFCYDCVYDLFIRVTNECGQEMVYRTARNYTPADALGKYYNLTCEDTALPIVDSFELVLEVGEYSVTKQLALQQDAIDFYYNDYLSKDTCIKTFDEFYQDALEAIDFSGCDMNCASCKAALGDSASFLSNYINEILQADSTKVLSYIDTAKALASYGKLADICDRLCDSFSVCDAVKNIMLHDMSPRGGQYAGYEYDNQTNTYTFNDPNSILTSSPLPLIFPSNVSIPVYADPGIVYYNELGIRDTVFIQEPGGNLVPKIPNQLTPEQFVNYWKPSWAEALLSLHPEYCKYEFCVRNTPSHDYDQAMLTTEEYDSAVAKGFLNPLNDNHSEVPTLFIPSTNPDPFFEQGPGSLSPYITDVQDKIRSYVNYSDNSTTIDYSLWEVASLSANCGNGSNLSCGDCTKNLYWNAFRNIYLGIKRQAMDELMNSECRYVVVPFGKVSRFETLNNSLAGPISDLGGGGNFNMADTSAYQQVVQDSINTYNFNCSSYSSYWWNQIASCGFASTDSATIIDKLIEICRKGQDNSHLFGASTTHPDSVTSFGLNSFEDVLQWAATNLLNNAVSYPSTECSHYLINNPLPYTVVPLYYQTAQVEKPAQCVCDNIVKYRFQYLKSGLSGSMSFGNYLTNIRNVVITDEDIQMLIDACNQTACQLLPRPISLPYQFSCNQVCANCAQVAYVYESFKTLFPNAHNSANYLTLLQSYMNSSLEMNLTALEYMDFLYDSCGYMAFLNDSNTVAIPSQQRKMMSEGQNGKSSKNMVNLLLGSKFTDQALFKRFSNVTVLQKGFTEGLPVKPAQVEATTWYKHKRLFVRSQYTSTTSEFVPFTAIKNLEQTKRDINFINNHQQGSTAVQKMANRKVDFIAWLKSKGAGQLTIPSHTGYSVGEQTPAAKKITNPGYSITYTPQAYTEDNKNRLQKEGEANNGTPTTAATIDIPETNLTQPVHGVSSHKNPNEFKHGANVNAEIQWKTPSDRSTQRGYAYIVLGSQPVVRQNNLAHNLSSTVSEPYARQYLGLGNQINRMGWSVNSKASKYITSNTSGAGKQHKIGYYSTWCDSVAAALAYYDSVYVSNGSYNYNNFNYSMWYNLGVYYSTQTWLQIIDTCQLPCPTIIRCSRADSVMQQFKNQYPQYADTCLTSIWVNYLNQNNASGNWNWYSETDWKLYLQCCGVSYPAADSLVNRCDSISAVVDAFATQGMWQVTNQLNNTFGSGHYSNGQWIYSDNAYWLSQLDSCSIPCNTVVNCGRLDSVMQQFKTQYPQLADSSIPSIWVNYLNQNNASGTWSWYNEKDWKVFLNCCGVSYPAADSLANRCDSISAVVDVFATQGMWQVTNQLNNTFGSSHYSNGQWIYSDNAYWLSQLDSCGIPCNTVVNCGRLDSVMQQFKAQYPQYADTCFTNVWVNYLNQNNASGTWSWYNEKDWKAFLNCCGISYPAADSLVNRCDSISAIVSVASSPEIGQLTNQLNNVFGWSHYSNGQWMYHDNAYWLGQLDSCGISCSAFVNCVRLDSIMQQFRTQYPQFADSCAPSIWVQYLNSNNALGNGTWYNETQWREFLNCCDIPIPVAVQPGICELVASVIGQFNNLPNQSLWNFVSYMGNSISWGHNDSLGNWVQHDYDYWYALIDSCNLPCPNLVNCNLANSAMQQFYNDYPAYVNSAPGFIWASYLNTANVTNGYWYTDNQWRAMLTCCGIVLPSSDSIGNTTCDTLQVIVNSDSAIAEFPYLPTLNRLRDIVGWGYNDSTGQWHQFGLAHYAALLDSCGIPCSTLVDCTILSNTLNQFAAANPQYADSCAAVIIEKYLNVNALNDNDWLSYDDWSYAARCCGLDFPANDTTLSYCDTAFAYHQFYSQLQAIVIDSLGASCMPNWLVGMMFNQMEPPVSASSLQLMFDSCGFTVADTCALYSYCDTLQSIVELYSNVLQYNGYQDSSKGHFAEIVDFVNEVLNTTYTTQTLAAELALCDTGNCEAFSEVWNMLQPFYASYDSCVPPLAFAPVYNAVTGLSLSNAQWCDILSDCNLSCPDTCPAIARTICDTALVAYQAYLNVIAVYNVGDSSEVLSSIFSAVFGYYVASSTAMQLIADCDTSCRTVAQVAQSLQPLFDVYEGCVPAWIIELAYNVNLPGGPYTYSQICAQLRDCGLPCLDTCGSLQPISCDSVLQLNALFNNALSIYGAQWPDTNAIFEMTAQAFWGSPMPYSQFLTLVDSCATGYCHPELANFSNGLDVLFNLYGECVPSWVVEVVYNANLPQVGYPSGLTYGEICQILQDCNLPCPDTCGSIPPVNCDSVLAVYGLWQNVINTYEGAQQDSINILNYIQTGVWGVAFDYPHFMKMVRHCDTTVVCDTLTQYIYQVLEPLFTGYDSCAPAWMLEAFYPVFAEIRGYGHTHQPGGGAAGGDNNQPFGYADMCEMLSACGYPCPDTCTPQYNCDSVSLAYQTVVIILTYYHEEGTDTNELASSVTQLGLGIPLNWNQLQIIYNQCFGNPEPLICNRPLMPPVNGTEEEGCIDILQEYAYLDAAWAYQNYIKNVHENFINQYVEKCLGAYRFENFEYLHPNGEYHFTLYYYDQAGNLVKTVPPAGFDTSGQANHTLPTVYRYNTLNQVIEQRTPDAGTSEFWYDRIGKLVVSRNQQQFHEGEVSYTLYDNLQRIIEVGRFDSLQPYNYAIWEFILAQSTPWYNNLLTGRRPKEITRTYYDYDALAQGGLNLRNRVASATYEEVEDFNPLTYQHASHYSYDIHGNVSRLTQENPLLANINQSKKVIEYKYDLISGKVNEVLYQRGQPDQFIHKYDYDGDNRLTDVYTSRDSTVFSHDAHYSYYLHGPLARTQLGGNSFTGSGSVQGLDYYYTLQGWLKGVNSTSLTTATDPGRDGTATHTAPDQFGFSLGYYNGDFQPIAWGNTLTASNHAVAATTALNQRSLYNGNISAMAVNIRQLNAPLAYKYHYDVLNRLVAADAYNGLDATQNDWTNNTPLTAYSNRFSYDANGNILTNLRKGAVGNEDMDDMAYRYIPGTNKLDHVDDIIAPGNYAVDIDDQDTLNYRYDSIGNLSKDIAEGIDTVLWNVYGKIKEIHKTNGDTLRFAYDAIGNRVMKEVYFDSIGSRKQTFYIRDATGNIMATYDYQHDTLQLNELAMYGSSRIGVVKPALQLSPAPAAAADALVQGVSYYLLNQKQYELSNHLGNVHVTVGDRRLPQYNSGTFTHYQAEVAYATDYYSFGMVMPQREFNAGSYRYSFGGHEKLDEVSGSGNTVDMGDRWLDVRLGRTPKMDRQANKFAGISPYSYALNNPIIYIDPDGEYPISIHVRSFAPFSSFGPGNLWKGDGSNRSFTTNYAGSRISMVTNYETETQVANSKAMGAMSFSKYGARAYSDAYLNNGQRSVTTTGNSLDLHLYGKNEALFTPLSPLGWSPGGRFTPTSDIDIHNRLTINATDGVLAISGQITGDQFPSAEAFVSDDFGNSIMLGTFATSGGRQMGPVKDLAGDRDLPMIDVNIRISVGENGAFQGVYSTDSDGNEIIMSPDAWNKQHESKPTTR